MDSTGIYWALPGCSGLHWGSQDVGMRKKVQYPDRPKKVEQHATHSQYVARSGDTKYSRRTIGVTILILRIYHVDIGKEASYVS